MKTGGETDFQITPAYARKTGKNPTLERFKWGFKPVTKFFDFFFKNY